MRNLRRVRLVLALIAVFAVAGLGWLMPSSRNSQAAPAPAPSGDTAFKGKIVLVNTDKMMTMSNFLLEKVQVQRLGDRSFLVGKGAAEGRMGAGYKDRTVRINVEHIVSLIEFDDVKEATKALQSGRMTVYGGGYGGFAPTATPVPIAIPGERQLPKPPLPPPPPGKQEVR